MPDFGDLINQLQSADLEEVPVDIETFVQSKDYLGMPKLSEYQYKIIRAGTQIYDEQTLQDIYGDVEGHKRYAQTFSEVIMVLGKGCHAPYTKIFNAKTGRWQRLDSMSTGDNVVQTPNGLAYATESFREGWGEMVRVTTQLGLSEDVFIGHSYYGYKKPRFYKRNERSIAPGKISAGSLAAGDRIGVRVGFEPERTTPIGSDVAFVLGLWIDNETYRSGDGTTALIDFWAGEEELLSKYLHIVESLGDSPRVVHHDSGQVTTVFHTQSTSPRLFEILDEFNSAPNKAVPDTLWSAPNSELSEFLLGVFKRDAVWFSNNDRLAEDIQKVSIRIGVPAILKSDNGMYTLFAGAKCDGLYFDKVVSVEPIGEGEYWTLTVPDTGTYVGNGMVSYNSGKDLCSTIICAYIVYLLLCLKDPQEYFGKPPGDMIDIMNIAINSAQAYNVFFRGVMTRIKRCPWFEGKYQIREASRIIEFDKSIRLISGHSESENLEGYNVLVVVLDEISGFGGEGTDRRVTAESTYKMHRASVTSRFGRQGKLLLLSFPRHKNDFIMRRYNEVIGDKDSVKRSHLFKLNADLPDGIEDNEFEIEWEEDIINAYKFPGVYALKRPSWEVNPTKHIDDYTLDFFTDPQDALTRFACMPSEATYGFFRDHDKVNQMLSGINGVRYDGTFRDELAPDMDKKYYIHVDLALKHDKCAVTMSHVDSWERFKFGDTVSDVMPKVVVDVVMWWVPSSDRTVDFVEVREFIMSLKARGFNIAEITFDQWHSETLIEYFNNAGIPASLLSVGRPQYDDLLLMVQAGRVIAPDLKELRDELLALVITPNGKVDHPRSGYNDLSDSMTGSIFNSATKTSPPEDDGDIEVVTSADMTKKSAPAMHAEGVIVAPKMPNDVRNLLEGMKII